jgi:hypothetical protein
MKDYLKNHHKIMKNNYYYLILPNKKVNFEAIEEVFREQEAYDKKFSNFSPRSGYMFFGNNIHKLPNKIFKNVISSKFFQNLKLNCMNSTNLKSILSRNFTIFVSTNKDFITWTTLKIVEIEKEEKISQNKLINYDGFLSNLS